MMVNITNIYQKALQAVEKRNFEYAIEMFIQCVSLAPDNLEVRKKLRSTARHMNKESGGSTSQKLKSFSGKLKGFFSQKLKKDPEKAMIDYEKCLAGDPDNIGLLKDLGAAAINAGQLETAIWVFNDALRLSVDNPPILDLLSKAYELHGDVKEAQETCQRLMNADSTNRDAVRRMKDLAAKETMSKGWDQAQKKSVDFHSMVKDQQQQEDLDLEGKILRTDEEVQSAIEMTIRQISEEPTSTRLMLKLGDLYKRISQWDDAQATYDKAFNIDKADFNIQFKLGQLRIDRLASAVETAKAAYQQDTGNEAAKKTYATQLGQLNQLKLDEYTKRVKAQPTNGRYHFDLAEHLFRLKKHRESIAEFQKVAHDPEFKLRALNYLGQSFTVLENFDLAEKQFLTALENARIVTDRFKPLIYHLGMLYVKMGRTQEAITQLNRIYEVDINFRDIAEVLSKLKA